ncbi:MAG: hypothetical protein ACJ756_07045, partial [Solirubrobacterales bacterium]
MAINTSAVCGRSVRRRPKSTSCTDSVSAFSSAITVALRGVRGFSRGQLTEEIARPHDVERGDVA